MDAFYDSEWCSGPTLKVVHNPFDESPIGEVPDFEADILDRVLDGLSQGQSDLLDLNRVDHHAIFVRLRDLFIRDREKLIRLLQLEQGKPYHEASQEYDSAFQSISVLADNASLIGPEILPIAKEPSSRGWQGFTLRQPHGIVGILTPVTYPLLFPVVHVCYALAASNAVVFKPARVTPLIALKLVELLLEAGFPPAAIACIPGPGRKLGKAICSDPRLNFLSCMGRIPTIKSIRKAASFIPVQLQWGCVSSVIADSGADLDLLVNQIVNLSFNNAGQSAFTASWIAAVDDVHDEIVDRIAAQLAGMKVGNPLDRNTMMGPVASAISKRTFDRVLEHELSTGAEIVSGGTREGRVIAPTFLRNCDPEKSILSREEVRAPLIGITKIARKEDVITPLAKQRYHILTLFTGQIGETMNEAMRLPFENIHINGIPTWRDGLICVPGHPPRSGVRDSYARVNDYCRTRDVVCHSSYDKSPTSFQQRSSQDLSPSSAS